MLLVTVNKVLVLYLLLSLLIGYKLGSSVMAFSKCYLFEILQRLSQSDLKPI